MMVEFTIEILTSWRLEGYTHISYREWAAGYVTLCPSHEETPLQLRILLKCESYPIYSPLIDALADHMPSRLYEYFVSESYELYRNFDEEHIDMEAEF